MSFQECFRLASKNGMLTDEGEEIFGFGIDEEVSIHERLITKEALEFLEKNYDTFISSVDYGRDVDCVGLDELYDSYLKQIEG